MTRGSHVYGAHEGTTAGCALELGFPVLVTIVIRSVTVQCGTDTASLLGLNCIYRGNELCEPVVSTIPFEKTYAIPLTDAISNLPPNVSILGTRVNCRSCLRRRRTVRFKSTKST